MDIQKTSRELLSKARLLPRHTFAIVRSDISTIVKQLDVLEQYIQTNESSQFDNDSVRLCLSEIHYILSECRYHQFCTIIIYFIVIVSLGGFLIFL